MNYDEGDVAPILGRLERFRAACTIHYGVTNMPDAVPRTSTFALTNTSLGLPWHPLASAA